MSTLPLIMTSTGPSPTSPADIRTALIDAVAATNPGYTANLPASLIEDIASTDVGAIATIDQARVDSVNDLTPYGANAYLLAMQGAMLGIVQNQPTNSNVYVQFSGTVGYSINSGFIVSDGTHQYVIETGGVIDSGGTSSLLYAYATQTGSWAIPAGTVTTVVSSVPSGITLTVTNPSAGISSSETETVDSYRGRILDRFSSPAQGVPGYVKTLIGQVTGVIPRLISVQQATGGWKVIVGGGDSYEVGYAIYRGVLELTSLVQSATPARNVTVNILDGNDSYTIPFINPPEQIVIISAVWKTDLTGFTSSTNVNELGSTSIQNYINSIIVGNPINLLEMEYEFQNAVSSVLPTNNLSDLSFTVSIDGSVVAPTAGTSLVYGDSESYLYCGPTGATVTQG